MDQLGSFGCKTGDMYVARVKQMIPYHGDLDLCLRSTGGQVAAVPGCQCATVRIEISTTDATMTRGIASHLPLLGILSS